MEGKKSAVPASLSGLFHHPLLARLQSADNLCFAPSLMSILPPMILIGYCIWYWLDIFVYFCHQYEVFIAPYDIDRILYLILILIGYVWIFLPPVRCLYYPPLSWLGFRLNQFASNQNPNRSPKQSISFWFMWHNGESCPLCGLKAIFLSTSCIHVLFHFS